MLKRNKRLKDLIKNVVSGPHFQRFFVDSILQKAFKDKTHGDIDVSNYDMFLRGLMHGNIGYICPLL